MNTELRLAVLPEVKKAIELWINVEPGKEDYDAFYSHILQIIDEQVEPYRIHKDQLERLIFKGIELRRNQAKYFSGHKNLLSLCRKQEAELDLKYQELLKKGYSIQRFEQQQLQQQQQQQQQQQKQGSIFK